MPNHPRTGPGPFRAHQLPEGCEYELSDGHPIHCPPNSDRHAHAVLAGGRVLASDPAVRGRAAIDVGIAFNDDKNLRAPDLIVADVERAPGWLRSIPPLAVEYADIGQDEAELAAKISELHTAGTRHIWVVRLTGPLRVEVHTRGEPMRTVDADGELTAPGVLQNPVPVRALVDRDAADAANLRNLLSKHGYSSIAEIHDEARTEGRAEGQVDGRIDALLAVLSARGLTPTPEQTAQIHRARDLQTLDQWLRRAVTAATVAELLT